MSVLTIIEPRTYSCDSTHSFFLDKATVASPHDPHRAAAQQRLDRYARELADEIGRGSPEGQRASRIVREQLREADPDRHERSVRDEIRAMSAGAGSGGSFVTPFYLTEDWVPALDVEPVLANQCQQAPLPSYGLTAYVPTFQSGSTAAIQETGPGTGEGNLISLDSPDPVAGYRQGPVETVSTGVTLSQQLVDRGGPVIAFDQALAQQLTLNVNAQLDALVYSQVASVATSTAGAGPASAGALYSDVASARERAYAAGTRVRPTHLFTNDRTFSWLSKVTDGAGRPILVPQWVPDQPPWGLTGARDDGHWSGFTGVVMPGALQWFVDETLPGTLLVSRPSTVLLAQGEPVVRVISASTYAGTLQAIAEVYQYVVCVPLIPAASQIVTGWSAAA